MDGTMRAWRPLATLLLVLGLVSACRGQEEDQLALSGTLEAAPARISAELPARVTRVAVEEGEAVRAGQVLATLDTSLVDAQRDEAAAAVDAARAELDRVRAGARPEELAAARAQLGQARALRDAAQAGLDLARSTGAAGPVPAAPGRTEAETALRQAEAAVAAAEAALAALEAGPGAAELAAAEAGLRQAEAGLAALEARRAALTLRSPQDGRVVSRAAERGQLALPGTSLFAVADLDPLSLTVYVPEDQVARVALGSEQELTVDAFPDETFTGTVSFIAPEAEFTPRNVQTAEERAELVFAVRLTVPNAAERLRPGMPADLMLALD